METKMHTLEELHAHYKAVRERLNGPAPVRAPEPEIKLPVEPPAPLSPTETPVRRILSEVAKKHCVLVSDIQGRSHKKKFVWPRQEAAYRMSVELKFSLGQIGRVLGGRDHTTILHGIIRHKGRVSAAEELANFPDNFSQATCAEPNGVS
jgi:hypothetical protein